MSTENIIIVVAIVLIVLFVLGYSVAGGFAGRDHLDLGRKHLIDFRGLEVAAIRDLPCA